MKTTSTRQCYQYISVRRKRGKGSRSAETWIVVSIEEGGIVNCRAQRGQGTFRCRATDLKGADISHGKAFARFVRNQW